MTFHNTTHQVESYTICCQVKDSMLSWTTTAADGKPEECRRTIPACGDFTTWQQQNLCARVEKNKQENKRSPLSTRPVLFSSVRAADFPAQVIRCSEWQHNCAVNLDESLAKGRTSPWAAWWCLNRLRTGVACCNEQRNRWKYFNGDTTCECGHAPETTMHMLQCPLLAQPYTLDDL